MGDSIKVARSGQIKENKPLSVLVDGKKIVLVRYQRQVLAFRDSCPHQGAPLSHGLIKNEQLVCIYHGWRFNLKDGSFTGNPQLKLKRFDVREEEGEVFVDVG